MRFVRGRSDPPDTLDVDAVREAVAIDGVSLAVVFGSYAAETAGPLSDLDVAVSFEPSIDRERKLRLMDELTVAIQDATGVEAVDLLDLDTAGPTIGYDALAHGILVYGERDTAIDLEARFLVRKLDFRPVTRAWQGALDERLREGTFGRP